MTKNVVTVLLSVLLSACAAYGIVKAATPDLSAATTKGSIEGLAYRTVNLSQTDYPDFTYAAETAVDAVVYVEVTVKSKPQAQIDPFFRYFFGDEFQSKERVQKGSGSGVIIRQDGYIVTNNHVVADASEVQVTLNNNETYLAKVIGTDAATDVALIKIDAEGLPVVEIADSDNLRLGEWVLAIGSPLGEELRSTITAGIVSAKGRSMPNYTGEFKIESFIQTDAAVNPGNSGGALVNKEGKLVGINTAIVSTTGSYSGYSFAVPSNIVKRIVSDLIDFGSVKRVLLGITGGNLTEEKASELKLSRRNGVYINEVQKGSSADKAGLKKDDVIIAVDGNAVNSMSMLQEKVNNFHPGDKGQVTVIREGKELVFDVTFQSSSVDNGSVQEDGSVAFYGSMLRTPSKEALAKLGLKKGVEIASVGPGKLLDAGASEGFIILYVNDQPVNTPQDVIDIANKTKRAVFIEGVTAYGKASYFGFGKSE